MLSFFCWVKNQLKMCQKIPSYFLIKNSQIFINNKLYVNDYLGTLSISCLIKLWLFKHHLRTYKKRKRYMIHVCFFQEPQHSIWLQMVKAWDHKWTQWIQTLNHVQNNPIAIISIFLEIQKNQCVFVLKQIKYLF